MKKSLGRNRSSLVAGLDVGTSKVCCFLAQLSDDQRPKIVGVGQQESNGLKKSTVVDLEATARAIGRAVNAAEQMADAQVDAVFVNVSGGRPISRSSFLEVDVSGHVIRQADLDQAIAECQTMNGVASDLEAGRQLLHSIPVAFGIDGNRGIRNPVGMYGSKLSVELHSISTESSAFRNLAACVGHAHLDIAGAVLSPYAAGLACLVEDEMALGVTLIDMGAGTTSIAVFNEGQLIHAEVLPVGGDLVTSDIARGLATPKAEAERLKVLYGHVETTSADETALIEVPQVGEDAGDAPAQVSRAQLIAIILPRLQETFELIREALARSGVAKLAGQRVVLVGGASQLPGVRDLAAQILERRVRIGRPIRSRGLTEAINGPSYAVCAGLLTYAEANHLHPANPRLGSAPAQEGLFGRLGLWLKEHF